MLASDQRGQRQTAYQVVVASSPELLKQGQGDLWDSGKVASDRAVPSSTPAGRWGPTSGASGRSECGTKTARRQTWSSPASWSMGILDPAEWRGKWLGYVQETPPATPNDWNLDMLLDLVSEGDPAKSAPAQALLPLGDHLPADAKVRAAGLVLTADDRFTLYVNGKPAGKRRRRQRRLAIASGRDLTTLLGPGRNLIAIEAVNVVGRRVWLHGGMSNCRTVPASNETSDASWAASQQSAAGWQNPAFDDSHWAKAKVLGPMGIGPWATPWSPASGRWAQKAPSPMFRKVFEVKKPLARATASICGLGYYELRLNGGKVGDRVLDPIFTRYDKRVLYATYDVTGNWSQGQNAIGVMLGNGFYNPHARDVWYFEKSPWRGEPDAALPTSPGVRRRHERDDRQRCHVAGLDRPGRARRHPQRRGLRRPAGDARLGHAALRRLDLGGSRKSLPARRACSAPR